MNILWRILKMNNLSDLRDVLIKKGKKIKEFGGWYLKVGKDIWTMLDGFYYLNNVKLTKKELQAIFNKK